MTVEQTKWFRIEVENYVRIGKEYRFIIGREQIAKDMVMRTAQYRGVEATNKVMAKANQKLRFKFYEKIAG